MQTIRHQQDTLIQKIMLIDIDDQTKATFASYGFNVVVGELGRPYKVQMSDKYTQIITDINLPYYQEQEIVVIDLVPFSPLDEPSGAIRSSSGEKSLWASCAFGIVDPRLITLSTILSDSQRILEHGGIFIVFAAAPVTEKFHWGQSSYQRLSTDIELEYSTYGFLDDLRSGLFDVERSKGNEIILNPDYVDSHIIQILAQYIEDAEYQCTFHTHHSLASRWMTLATNKFEASCGWNYLLARGGRWIYIYLPSN